jgi:hypothetical protein
MKRTISMLTAIVVATTAPPPSMARDDDVDLDAPGALATLSRADPERYATVVNLLDDAARIAPAQARGLLHVRYAADDVELGMMLMTSLPAKRRLSFRLADVRYRATVSVVAPVAGLVPAR